MEWMISHTGMARLCRQLVYEGTIKKSVMVRAINEGRPLRITTHAE
jgi:hypothetical protein